MSGLIVLIVLLAVIVIPITMLFKKRRALGVFIFFLGSCLFLISLLALKDSFSSHSNPTAKSVAGAIGIYFGIASILFCALGWFFSRPKVTK